MHELQLLYRSEMNAFSAHKPALAQIRAWTQLFQFDLNLFLSELN